MAHENKYQERFRYAKRFVEGKTVNPVAPQSESEVVRDLYKEILTAIKTTEDVISPHIERDSEYAYRSALWSVINTLIRAARECKTTEDSKRYMDAAEELAAILTTHFPKD